MEYNRANLHTSQIENLNEIRKKLWENVYNDPIITKTITNIIGSAFNDNIISLEHNMYDNTITINTNRIYSNIEIIAVFSDVFVKIVKELYETFNVISAKEYNICITRTSLLYNLILNNESTIVIKL